MLGLSISPSMTSYYDVISVTLRGVTVSGGQESRRTCPGLFLSYGPPPVLCLASVVSLGRACGNRREEAELPPGGAGLAHGLNFPGRSIN